jgi:tetratricopeptide (TPR) repeat protein
MTSVTALSGAYGRQERFSEGLQFVAEKIAVSENPANKARLFTQYAALAIADEKPEKALTALEEAIKLGQEDRRSYYLAAVAALQSGKLDDAEKYHALAQNVPSDGNARFSMDSMYLDIGVDNFDKLIELKKMEADQTKITDHEPESD